MSSKHAMPNTHSHKPRRLLGAVCVSLVLLVPLIHIGHFPHFTIRLTHWMLITYICVNFFMFDLTLSVIAESTHLTTPWDYMSLSNTLFVYTQAESVATK